VSAIQCFTAAHFVEEGHYLSEGLKIVELPGHTPGCIGLLCEKEDLLVAGDAVKTPIISIFGISAYISILKPMVLQAREKRRNCR